MPRSLAAPLVLLLLTTVAAGQESDSNTRCGAPVLTKAHAGPGDVFPIASSQSSRTLEPEIICAEQDKDVAASLRPYLQQGQQKVERFFGEPFQKPFQVEVFPHRAAFDNYFRKRWKVPKTEPWMVASGVADRLVILSPRVWKTQAAEHDSADSNHVRDLVAHELVHVYHGQHNPRPDFDGMDDSGWLVEGLAVYVSGQLERSHRSAARDALKAGKAPTRLADGWSGKYRYGVSGSMVEFVDKRYGRDVIKKLLAVVNNEEALKLLNATEGQFLEQWSEAYKSESGQSRILAVSAAPRKKKRTSRTSRPRSQV